MISTISFNKSKAKTIIFFHGFYATSGFWLPYISCFKNYKIILVNINYPKALVHPEAFNQLFSNTKDVLSDKNIVAIVSHSLGTLFSKMTNNETICHFEICPVLYSKRIDSLNFLTDISSKVAESKEVISNNLNLVDKLILNSPKHILRDEYFYVPSNDAYFEYNIPSNNVQGFQGDHFNIEKAIELIEKEVSNDL